MWSLSPVRSDMSNNTTDIQSWLEYLEKHVEDDEEIEIILYQEDSTDGGKDHEYSGGENDKVDQDGSNGDDNGIGKLADGTVLVGCEALQAPAQSKTRKPKMTSLKSTPTISKPTSKCGTSCGKLTATNKEASDVILPIYIKQGICSEICDSHETNRIIDEPDCQDRINAVDDSDCVETEANGQGMSPTKPAVLGQYQCMKCLYNTNKKKYLRRHLKIHSGEHPHICTVCEKSFICKDYLREHLRIHMDLKTFQCADCDKAFVSSSRLSRHKKENHSGMKPIKCTECDYSTVDRGRLKRHMYTHTDERPYKCSHCTSAFHAPFKLKRHMKTHTGEKPYECDICQSRFTRSDVLKSHLATHSIIKPALQCLLCPTILRSTDNLRKHMKRQHNAENPNKTHRCPNCNQSFTLYAKFLDHRETHVPNLKCY